MTDRIFQWPASRSYSKRPSTDSVTVHCSATPEGKSFDATDIDGWHRKQGWAGIGYHYVIHLDGSIEAGRPEDAVGAHVEGHNSTSIGVVYIGGTDALGHPKDTRTPDQKSALKQLLVHLAAKYKLKDILGHRDWPKVAKACPSFDVRAWVKQEGIKTHD